MENSKDIEEMFSKENVERMVDELPLEVLLSMALSLGLKLDPDKLIERANKEKLK
jgi:hypothetical protein